MGRALENCVFEEVSASRSCSLEESTMGQKWPGSRIPIVISHWPATWGDWLQSECCDGSHRSQLETVSSLHAS